MNVYILLDRSGSMQSLWSEAIGSINGYVEKLTLGTKVYLATFDSVSFDVLREGYEWKKLTTEEVQPRGGTPLFDSAAKVMLKIQEDNPERALFLVMTDGEENSSHVYKQAQVKTMVDMLKARKYEVIFLGANFDKVGDVAQQFGVASNKFTTVTRGSMREYMTSNLADATAIYGNIGAAIDITDEDKKAATTGSK